MPSSETHFKPGNPGGPGRPKGLARATREVVSDRELAEFWKRTMNDANETITARLRASENLADRGWGRPEKVIVGDAEQPIPVEVRASVDDLARVASILARAGALGASPGAQT